jgi:hypothetical protein
MRTKLFLIAVALILGANALAQTPDACIPPPVFCKSPSPIEVQRQTTGECEDAIKDRYRELLGIARDNWNWFDYKFNSKFYSGGRNKDQVGVPGGPYDRCLEQNDRKYDANDRKYDAKESFQFKDLFRLRNSVTALSEPLPIEGSKLYLNENQQNYQCMANKEPYLADFGQIIGRLEIRYERANILVSQVPECPDHSCDNYPIKNDVAKENYAQWGTAIQLADNAVLTSCHVLESLVDDTGNLSLGNDKLFVDFGERTDRFDYRQRQVKSVLYLSQTDGFDIAVLELYPAASSQQKQKQKASFMNSIVWGLPEIPDGQEVAVIGYPDFHHFLDPCAEAAFDPYKTQGDAKFVSLGCAFPPPQSDACNKEAKEDAVLFDTLFHTATTTMGESGSILVARSVKPPTIIGVHICCSYPQNPASTQYTPPPSKLKCANVKRTQYNQAISLCSLFKDQKLLNKLKAMGFDSDKAKKNCGLSSMAAGSQKQ